MTQGGGIENPRDRGACWAAVYGVAQSRTWLTRLSSSMGKNQGNKKKKKKEGVLLKKYKICWLVTFYSIFLLYLFKFFDLGCLGSSLNSLNLLPVWFRTRILKFQLHQSYLMGFRHKFLDFPLSGWLNSTGERGLCWCYRFCTLKNTDLRNPKMDHYKYDRWFLF